MARTQPGQGHANARSISPPAELVVGRGRVAAARRRRTLAELSRREAPCGGEAVGELLGALPRDSGVRREEAFARAQRHPLHSREEDVLLHVAVAEALGGARLQQHVEQLLRFLGDGVRRRRERHVLRDDVADRVARVGRPEGRLQREALAREDAERPPVGRVRVSVGEEHLRRHVLRSPAHAEHRLLVLNQGRQPEVGQHRPASLVEQHVLGLHVAVEHAQLVQLLQREDDAREVEAQRLLVEDAPLLEQQPHVAAARRRHHQLQVRRRRAAAHIPGDPLPRRVALQCVRHVSKHPALALHVAPKQRAVRRQQVRLLERLDREPAVRQSVARELNRRR
mmetsp:Transcript_30522/g.70950  ORF Transcript_30522/g.70950 Transcript_30522/m.70950 type:complete len:339 (-) Transcript_30522:357-1373(-)